MAEVFDLCWMMLGWFVAGMIFLFCVALLIMTISLSLYIAKEVYENYLKGAFKR